MIGQLQYITQDNEKKSHVELCFEACESGAKWIQLRRKNVSDEQYLREAKDCRSITRKFGAKLIINDNIDVAIACEADGVHLGQSDLNTKTAREQAPENFIIGGTANTFEQVKAHAENGVDYVGVGPYRFTTTKDKLSPILGLEGYNHLLARMRQENISIPLIAIGGIETDDVAPLVECGVHGVAVSGLITNSTDKEQLVKEIHKTLRYETA